MTFLKIMATRSGEIVKNDLDSLLLAGTVKKMVGSKLSTINPDRSSKKWEMGAIHDQTMSFIFKNVEIRTPCNLRPKNIRLQNHLLFKGYNLFDF